MKHVLIITEDVVKIQTLTKFLGRFYARIYITWLSWRTKVLIFFLKPFYRVTVLVSSDIGFSGKNNFFYGDELARADYARDRDWYWQVTNRLLENLPLIELFKTRLTIYLTYHYLIYFQVYSKLIDRLRPDRILVMGQSFHEQIATGVGRGRKVPVIVVNWFSLSRLQKIIQKYLLNREYSLKVRHFIAQMSRPSGKMKQGAVLLSVDFYRHLKTLMPLYSRLKEEGQQAYLITDVNNLQPTLDNLYIHQPEIVFLAAFFPQGQRSQIGRWPREFKRINFKSGGDWLYRLSLEAAGPMISKSLLLSRLYLTAADSLFKKLKPKGVVVVSDLRFCELALATTAKRLRVPSVLASPNTMVDLTGINPYQSADQVAVVGRYIKKQLTAIGVDAKKIHVVGDLVKENINEARYHINKQKVYDILGIPRNKKLVLAISFRPTWMIPKEEKEAYIRLAVDAVSQIPNAGLVIKPHPTEKRYRVLEELNDWGIKNVIVSDNDKVSLLDLLHASQVVLQTWSFTIFEAIMVNRPVIVINPFRKNYNYFLPIIKGGGAVEVSSLRALKQWLTVFVDPRRPQTKKQLIRAREASDQFIHFSEGKASGKVIELLLGK